jgi:putative membrane protein
MILVFRVNSAYDRWWEGRKLWGELVNNSRNLAIKLNAYISKEDVQNRKLFYELISNYPFASKQHLREEWQDEEFKFSNYLPLEELKNSSHRPNFLAKKLMEQIEKLKNENKLDTTQVLNLNQELSQLTNIIGGCERLKNTPIPYSYSIFLKKIIFIYVFSMPFCFALQFGYWTIGIVMIVFYAFASIELIAEEIEDPFGKDDNDLPTDELSNKIRSQVQEILIPKLAETNSNSSL